MKAVVGMVEGSLWHGVPHGSSAAWGPRVTAGAIAAGEPWVEGVSVDHLHLVQRVVADAHETSHFALRPTPYRILYGVSLLPGFLTLFSLRLQRRLEAIVRGRDHPTVLGPGDTIRNKGVPGLGGRSRGCHKPRWNPARA